MDVIVVPLALVVWTLVIVAVALMLRLRRGKPSRRDCALEELAARYARGEIDASEYRRRHRTLSRDRPDVREPLGRSARASAANGAGGATGPAPDRRTG